MRTRYVITLFCLVLVAAAGKLPSPCSVLKLTSIGFPAAEKARDAWSIHDLIFFNGRLYLGHGDAVVNTGPTDVIYYDFNQGAFVTEFTVDDEAIYQYQIVNNTLMIPGVDATEDWSFGNFYALSDTGWTKYRTIPNGLHVNQLAYFNDALYASTGALASVGDNIEFAFGAIYSSTDYGETWSLSYATPGDDKSVYRVYALIDYHDQLYAFPFCYAGFTKEEIPEKYHPYLSETPYDDEYYLILIHDIFGQCDVLVNNGNRWSCEDIIPEKNVAYVSKPFVFNDKLVMPVLCGEYIDYLNRHPKDVGNIKNLLFAYDGRSSHQIKLKYDRLIDVLVKNTTLYLLIEHDNLFYVASTPNLKKWEYILIPPRIEEPSAIEFIDNTFFIGTNRGNIFASLSIEPIKDIKDAENLEPEKIFGAAVLPRDGRWNWVSINDWAKWGEQASFTAEAKFGNIIKLSTNNIAKMTIHLPYCHLSTIHPVTVIIDNMVTYEGEPDDTQALVCTWCEDQDSSRWCVESVHTVDTTYTKKFLGTTTIPLTRTGKDPFVSTWTAEVLRWFTGANCAVITQSTVRKDIAGDTIYLEDIFDAFYRNQICTFTTTGTQLLNMITYNLKQPDNQKCAVAGVLIDYTAVDSYPKIIKCSLIPDKQYFVACDDFLVERSKQLLGQDIECSTTESDIYDALLKWFDEHSVIEKGPQGLMYIEPIEE
jgi:hypothetical protein